MMGFYAVRRKSLLALALLGLLGGAVLSGLPGCTPRHVQVDYDATASFTGLKSYMWAPHTPPLSGDPRVDSTALAAAIRAAVADRLRAQGYVLQPSDADFGVGYQVVLATRREVRRVTQAYGPGPTSVQPFGQGLDWFQSGFSETYERQYNVGSLILDILHPATGQRLWRGIAPAEIRLAAPLAQQKTQIARAVRRLLARFPPAPQ